MTGCSAADCHTAGAKTQEPDYALTLESTVDEADCFVCGDPPGGLLDYYSKFDSIGIIYWPDLTIIDTGVRAYDEDGNEVLDGSSANTRISSFGEGNGSIICNPWPERGISEVKIYLGDAGGLNWEPLREQLCQSCLDKVCEFYADHANSDDEAYLATTRYDFGEQGDGEQYIDLMVVYAPERA